MFSGCYTALITPMLPDGDVDLDGLRRLIEFQVAGGVKGLLAVGTTGESPTLSWDEHNNVVLYVRRVLAERGITIAGSGSNNTAEAIRATQHAWEHGVQASLLVDPYYNGPSSLEIRREYIAPIAQQVPQMQLIPYVIPSRTGTQLLPEDIAILHDEFPNVRCVKEATGNMENMRRTRVCCGRDFDILSGDDDITFQMMTDPSISASGVISVTSNIAPEAVQKMVALIAAGKMEEAGRIRDALKPLFSIITVKTQEETPYGPVMCRARNPLPTKTLMNLLGMPSGPCRRPLGRMTRKGLDVVVKAVREVWERNPEILRPIEEAFGVKIEERITDPKFREGLAY